ncbi:unnamed protein product [Boreogadus saida]
MAGDGPGEETDRGETMWSEEDGGDQAWPMEQLAPAATRQPNGGRWRATRQQPVEDATVQSKRPGGFGKQPRRARQTATVSRRPVVGPVGLCWATAAAGRIPGCIL